MKKLATIYLALFVLLGSTIAQQKITDTREYGNWLFLHPSEESADNFNPPRFPPTAIKDADGGNPPMPLNATRQKFVNDLFNVFKELYPKPHLESIIFGLEAQYPDNVKPTPYLSFRSSLKPEKFWYDNAGKVKKFNAWSQVGGYYGGGFNISVNWRADRSIAYFNGDFFQIIKEFSVKVDHIENKNGDYEVVETPRMFGAIYAAPPKNNFAYAAEKFKIGKQPIAVLPNVTNKMQYWRQWMPNYPKNGQYSGSISNVVFMSYNGNMPFINVTQAEYLDLWDLLIKDVMSQEKRWAKEKERDELKIDPNYLSTQKYAKEKKYNDDKIAAHNAVIEFINKLRKKYSATLNQPAYLNRVIENQDKYIFNWDLLLYFKQGKFENLFTNDANTGLGLLRADPNYYKGIKPDEIRFLAITWSDGTVLATEKKANAPYATINVNDDWDNLNQEYTDFKRKGKKIIDYSLSRALTYRMDWKKLENLLSK